MKFVQFGLNISAKTHQDIDSNALPVLLEPLAPLGARPYRLEQKKYPIRLCGKCVQVYLRMTAYDSKGLRLTKVDWSTGFWTSVDMFLQV